MGRHSVEDNRAFWRSAVLTIAKWITIVLLPILAAVGIWKFVSDLRDAKPNASTATSSPSPSKAASPSPEPSVSAIASVQTSPSVETSPSQGKQSTRVQVLNGSGTQGLGIKAKDKLQAAGYEIVATQNASRKYTKTTVYFQPGYEAMANQVAQLLGASSVLPALSNLDKKIPITAVIGTDYKP